ncbi:hypothetical protein ACT048_20765 [Ectopseudomonas khazarica]|uniref:hypothetical protein n=1 Tax=Ectopseudomonas khazarica TaxID=2502979 RepID=UPI0040335792
MAGLDTRGAWDGFVQGFQLMDNYQNRRQAQQRADQQLDMQQRSMDMRGQEMAASRDLAERRFGLAEQQLQAQGERFNRQMDMQDRQFGLQERQLDRQTTADRRNYSLQERRMSMLEQERGREQDMQILRAGYAKIAEGQELGDDEIQAFKRNPWLAPAHVADPRMEAAVARAAKVLDPKDPADANDPESLEAINYMFGPRIARGDGGQKKIVGVYPGQTPGTLAFELEVTDEGGKSYRAPMTRNRSTADDDEVLQIPIEDVVNQVAGYKTLSGVLQASGGRERAVALGQRLGLVNQFDSTKDVPADVQTAKWLVNSGAAPDVQSAWAMVRGARGKSRQDFALDYAKMIANSQDPMAENTVSANQAFQAGLDMYDRLNGGAQEQASEPAAGAPSVPAAPPGADADAELRSLGLW